MISFKDYLNINEAMYELSQTSKIAKIATGEKPTPDSDFCPDNIFRGVTFMLMYNNAFYAFESDGDGGVVSHGDMQDVIEIAPYSNIEQSFTGPVFKVYCLYSLEPEELRSNIKKMFLTYLQNNEDKGFSLGSAGRLDKTKCAFWSVPSENEMQVFLHLLKKLQIDPNNYWIYLAGAKTVKELGMLIGIKLPDYLKYGPKGVVQDKEKMELLRKQHLDAQAKQKLKDKGIILPGKSKDITKGYTTFGDSVISLY